MTKNNYKIVIKVIDDEWIEKGSTIESTLAKFQLTWEQIKGKGFLTISDGTKKYERIMNVFVLRRIFASKIVRAYWAKNLKMLLKSGVNISKPQTNATQGTKSLPQDGKAIKSS